MQVLKKIRDKSKKTTEKQFAFKSQLRLLFQKTLDLLTLDIFDHHMTESQCNKTCQPLSWKCYMLVILVISCDEQNKH